MQISFHTLSVKVRNLSSAHQRLHRFVFENYPEALWCVLVGQREIEEVMSLNFKPHYPGGAAVTRPSQARQPRFSQTEAEMNGGKSGGEF